MNATKKAQTTISVNLSLSIADHEWFEAYAKVTEKTFSDAASKGMSNWLNSVEGYGSRGDLIERANAQTKGKAKRKKPSNLVVFPSR